MLHLKDVKFYNVNPGCRECRKKDVENTMDETCKKNKNLTHVGLNQ